MFNPESEVPSLELCKKLKDLGYPQDGGGWYWTIHKKNYAEVNYFNERLHGSELWSEVIKAPTVTEMWEWLPDAITIAKEVWILNLTKNLGGELVIEYRHRGSVAVHRVNRPVIAMAETLIWLAENGYVRFGDERKTSL